jgi:hypothetical protein
MFIGQKRPEVSLARPVCQPGVSGWWIPLAGVIAQQGRDLRGFLQLLERRGQLRRISAPVDPDLELTAIAGGREPARHRGTGGGGWG